MSIYKSWIAFAQPSGYSKSFNWNATAPAQMIETTIMLKPESEWREGMTKEKLIAELTEKLGRVSVCYFSRGYSSPLF
jgi:Cu/Ag efflux pump CusA